MTGKRRVGLGSVVVKQSGGGGAATAFKQGGGNKLIGLISTRNMTINGAMVRNIRTRSDGGRLDRENAFTCSQSGDTISVSGVSQARVAVTDALFPAARGV